MVCTWKQLRDYLLSLGFVESTGHSHGGSHYQLCKGAFSVESACVFADGACIQVSLYLFSTSNARRKMFIEGRHHLALLVLNKYSNCAFSKKSFFKYSCLDVDRPDSPKGTVGVLVQYKQRKKKDVH